MTKCTCNPDRLKARGSYHWSGCGEKLKFLMEGPGTPAAVNDKQAEAAARKMQPIYSGLLKYFPRACAYVAHVSYVANEQHNPGESMRWSREKSSDHEDCLVRHLKDRAEGNPIDTDGLRHMGKAAWRSFAALELELEAAEKPTTFREVLEKRCNCGGNTDGTGLHNKYSCPAHNPKTCFRCLEGNT